MAAQHLIPHQICPLTWSGGPDLNRRPLRPERICTPATRYFAAYGAPDGVRWNPFRASYGGKMAAAPVPTVLGRACMSRLIRRGPRLGHLHLQRRRQRAMGTITATAHPTWHVSRGVHGALQI